MKRILSVLLIALLATTAVFADWAFSGNFDIGYTFGFDGDTTLTTIDGDNSAPEAGFLYLKGGNDYISFDVRGELEVVKTGDNAGSLVRGGGIGMTATLNATNLLNLAFGLELPVDVNFYLGNQSPETDADYAYADPSGIDDEISLGASRNMYPAGVSVGYGSLITGYAYAALDIAGVTNPGNAGGLFEIRANPIAGVRANIGYVASAAETAQDF